MSKRSRKRYTPELKREAVSLVTEHGYSKAEAGRSLDINPNQALTMALFRRGFPKEVIIHSDRGSQYCSKLYQGLIQKMGLRSSMGRRATCYDNAAMESFFHSLKVELIHRERYKTRQSANPHTSPRLPRG